MKIVLQSNAIRHQTDKATLIKLPSSELCFWHPTRFVSFYGKNDHLMKVWFGSEDWIIKARRTSEKTREVLEEFEMSVLDVAAQYELQIEN